MFKQDHKNSLKYILTVLTTLQCSATANIIKGHCRKSWVLDITPWSLNCITYTLQCQGFLLRTHTAKQQWGAHTKASARNHLRHELRLQTVYFCPYITSRWYTFYTQQSFASTSLFKFPCPETQSSHHYSQWVNSRFPWGIKHTRGNRVSLVLFYASRGLRDKDP